MARYSGPVCRLCRREGTKLFLKGSRCLTEKCAVDRRGYPPGQHGQSNSGRGSRKMSEYARQLREKQKVKRIYGLSEQQFRNTFERASKEPGVTGHQSPGPSGNPARQPRLPDELRDQPRRRPPAGPARSRRGEWQAGGHTVFPGASRPGGPRGAEQPGDGARQARPGERGARGAPLPGSRWTTPTPPAG